MRYLLTNDDGIYARGLAVLHEELSKDAECLIVAPEVEQSAVGHAITITRPLMVRPAKKNGYFYGYAVAGTPADCVKIGVRELAGGPVDLVVSGINRGANVGINVLYSGTVSAATESAILGIPSLAVSLDSYKDADYSFAARFARKMAAFIVQNPIPGVVLNVNIPNLPPEQIKGVIVVKQGYTRIKESYDKRIDPRENTYYWLMGETKIDNNDDPETDIVALSNGYITVTPLKFDMTCHDLLGDLSSKLSRLL
ncbi:MAG: 5'/3'-nucleotidase SurE [Syntrophales bacterium]|nr:5'/3'-nucleotidase SurE [Syntrophales bacterium]